jgi:hypothetical protein
MRNMPLSWRITVVVGTIIGTWTSTHVAEYRAQAWAKAPVENWTDEYKPTNQQIRDLHDRERALQVGGDQQHDDYMGDHAQLDAP